MSIIFGANGQPASPQAPQVLRPGQQPISLAVGETPQGVALAIQMGGEPLIVPFPPGGASQLGMALIGAEAVWQAKRQKAAPEAPRVVER